MNSDRQLQREVLDRLELEPDLDAARIGVSADHGVVTLSGIVTAASERMHAEAAVRAVRGVEAVVNEIEVSAAGAPDDVAIAQRVLSALDWEHSVPRGSIKPTVSHGWLTLDGETPWSYQKRAAEDAVRNLFGVRGVTNRIVVRPTEPTRVMLRLLEQDELITT